MNIFKKFLNALIYIFLPKICFHCKEPLEYDSDSLLCENCIKQIKFINDLVCQKCGVPLISGGAHCYNCKERKYYFEFLRGVVEYDGPIKTLIHEFKYNQKVYFKKFFNELLINWWKRNSKIYPPIDIVCCVPIHPIKKFLRGYNQAELLAEDFSKEFKLDFYPRLLKRIKITKSQFKLSKEKRILNVKDAFEVEEKFKDLITDKNILIIDDVCTTAETINQCAKVLKISKPKGIFAFVLARDV